MPNRSGRYRGTELQQVGAQHRTAVGRLVMLRGAVDALRLFVFPKLHRQSPVSSHR
jgi:hypothetical protein